jgi:FG-GAP repeat
MPPGDPLLPRAALAQKRRQNLHPKVNTAFLRWPHTTGLMKYLIKLLPVLIALSSHSTAQAQTDLSELKLQGRWPAGTSPAGINQGSSVALSDKWALSSVPASNLGLAQEGAVQVFSATTGAWVRLLRLPSPAVADAFFGRSMAISGDLAVISAHGLMSKRGAVYVFNLSTGALIRKIAASDGNTGDMFGRCVALSGGKLVVGASNANGSVGAAYIFDLTSGLQLAKLIPSDMPAGASFGISVAAEGNIALIGAQGRQVQRGAGYVFDLTTFAELAIIVPAASAAGNEVGLSVSLHQGVAILAAPKRSANKGAVFTRDLRTNKERTLVASDGVAGDFFGLNFTTGVAASHGVVLVGSSGLGISGAQGSVYAFDLQTGQQLVKLRPSDSAGGSFFGGAVAMWGNNAMVGSQGDNSPLTAMGAAYLFKSLTTALPLTKVTARGDSAPSAPEAAFSVMGDAFINSQSEVAFGAKLAGPGSHANTDTGVWTNLRSGGYLNLAALSYDLLGPATILSIGTPIVNQEAIALYPVTLKTGVGGITTLNNKAIFVEQESFSGALIQTGSTVPPFGTAKLLGFTELVQSHQSGVNGDRWAVTCTLRQEAATSTTALNDSGLYIQDVKGNTDGRREGQSVPATLVNYGQFSGRVAFDLNSLTYSAATTAPVAKNAVIMVKDFGGTEVQVAGKGLPAPVIGGPLFSAFIGETVDGLERVVYRATVSGGGVTAANNEGLWGRTNSGMHELVLRKGPNAKLPVGLTIAKIIQFWGIYGPDSQVMALVQLGGVGVTAASDQALVLVQEDDSLTILVREGQPAPGCHPASIGVISRVEVDPYDGYYAVLTTLTGAPAGTDLALFTGHTVVGNHHTKVTLRRPMLYLRKGALYDNQPSKIKSLSLPSTNITASGAGCTGRGRAISWNQDFVITVEFENGVRQIMKGQL